jgi:hypothetical protein
LRKQGDLFNKVLFSKVLFSKVLHYRRLLPPKERRLLPDELLPDLRLLLPNIEPEEEERPDELLRVTRLFTFSLKAVAPPVRL